MARAFASLCLYVESFAVGGPCSSVERYLPDTDTVWELRKDKPHGGVLAWIKEWQAGQIYLSE